MTLEAAGTRAMQESRQCLQLLCQKDLQALDRTPVQTWWFTPIRVRSCTFSPCCNKRPDRSSIKKERLILIHSLSIQSIMVRKAWEQQFQAAATRVKSQEAERDEC